MTHIDHNPAEPAPFEVCDARGVLSRHYSAKAARAWQAEYDRTRRAPAEAAPMGLEEIGRMMERLSRGGK